MKRLVQLGKTAAGLAGDFASKADILTSSLGESFHVTAAKRLATSLGEMKALPLKLGQMLSYVNEAIPEEHRHVYAEILGELQAHTEAASWEHIEAVFVEEHGRPPGEVFDTFDETPIAAASIGQVYRARTRDGREVVVKIQYPGVAEAIRNDLDNVEMLVKAMTSIIPKTDVQNMVDDATARIAEECDYVHEAASQRAFASSWSGDEQVVIPAVVGELSTERVLVSEYIDARPWNEMLATASDDEKSDYGEVIFRFVFQSLYCYGMFNADPHPGNYLFYPDGRVAFIDYGCVQRYDLETAIDMRALRDGIIDGARGPALRGLIDRAFGMPDNLDDEMWRLIEEYVVLGFEPVIAPQPYRFVPDYPARLTKLGIKAKLAMSKKVFKVGIQGNERPGIVFMARINFGLTSILATLGTRSDWREKMLNLHELEHHGLD